jgi:formiminotetrahydrofolate cyclodeaminase
MQDSADIPTSTPLDGWLSELGEAQGAIGAALLRMVAEYTDAPRATECSARLVGIRAEALAAVEADGVASAQFGAALALPTDDPARDARVRDAAITAAHSSAQVGAVGIRLTPEVRLLDEIGNRSLLADLAVAAEALRAQPSTPRPRD